MIQIVFQGILGVGNWKQNCQIDCKLTGCHGCTETEAYAISYGHNMSNLAKPIHHG